MEDIGKNCSNRGRNKRRKPEKVIVVDDYNCQKGIKNIVSES